MKKISVLAAAMLGFCGSLVCGYADAPDATEECGFSAEEQNFASKLTPENEKGFCKMTADQRASCMKMAQTTDANGNKMTPDQAVQTLAVPGDCTAK